MQASVTGRIAASAKVQTPVARLLGIRCGDDAQFRPGPFESPRRRKLGRSGNVVRVPPEPLPSPAGAVESQQRFVVRGIAPTDARRFAGFLRVLLGHGAASSRRAALGNKLASSAVRRSVAGKDGSRSEAARAAGRSHQRHHFDIGAWQTRGFRVQPEIVEKSGQSSGGGVGIVPQRKKQRSMAEWHELRFDFDRHFVSARRVRASSRYRSEPGRRSPDCRAWPAKPQPEGRRPRYRVPSPTAQRLSVHNRK